MPKPKSNGKTIAVNFDNAELLHIYQEFSKRTGVKLRWLYEQALTEYAKNGLQKEN